MNNKVLNLSSREFGVLEYLNQGYSSKLIAKKLEISPFTVNGHLKSIYFKFNVNSRGEAQNKFNEHLATIASSALILQIKDKAARAAELVTANIELSYQTEEKKKRADELVIANEEKASRAAELTIANIELLFQTEEKKKRADELVIANEEKASRAAELATANIELLFQTEEKKKRADELVIANEEKASRAAELAIANIELLFQTEEKKKRADELVIANEYKPALRSALLLMLKRALIQLRDRAQYVEKQGAKRVALHPTAVNYIITTDEFEALLIDKPR
jgi:DNA-binding CsgD family transcriptional regulator